MQKLFNIYKKYKEQINYLIFGGLTTLISIISFALIILILPNALISNIFSWMISVLFAYVTNAKYVFNSNLTWPTFIKFTVSRLATLVLEEILLFITINLLSFNALIGKIIAQIVVIIANYVLSKLAVFTR